MILLFKGPLDQKLCEHLFLFQKEKFSIQGRHYPTASLRLTPLGFVLQRSVPVLSTLCSPFLTLQGECQTVCYGICMRLLHSKLRKSDLNWERDDDAHHLLGRSAVHFFTDAIKESWLVSWFKALQLKQKRVKFQLSGSSKWPRTTFSN